MKRRFLVSVSGLSEDETTRLREFLGKKAAWWNWIPNFWLLITGNQEITCEAIRDKVIGLNGEAKCLVMEIGPDIDWATLGGANKDGKRMTDWLNDTWAAED
uniref:Uncharacterized protein n=1 Tax=Sinorhizobium xinjiangense TaxID=28106 RepID=D1CTW6_9HYPH|nr:hypothetical protein [Sinorhizobium xinjiangense]